MTGVQTCALPIFVGYLMFAEVPDAYVWLGTALIVSAGLMVGWSGRKRI